MRKIEAVNKKKFYSQLRIVQFYIFDFQKNFDFFRNRIKNPMVQFLSLKNAKKSENKIISKKLAWR